MISRTWIPLLLTLFAVGCSAPEATFRIEVMNISTTPISAGLIKNGPPHEDGWYSPSEIAIGAPALADRHWGTLIKPGETKVIGPQTGHFAEGSSAVLRIYGGNPTVEELLAVSRDAPDRLEVYLWPGESSYVINNPSGRLTSTRAEDFTKSPRTP